MQVDAWIYCRPSAWGALSPDIGWKYTYDSAVTGFWKPYLVDFEVYNVLGSDAQIQSMVSELDPLDNPHTFAWVQGPGYDYREGWITIPAEVLAVMKDHVTYDDVGNETSRTPATQLNPNWGHVFLGQGERIFAGDFNEDFNGDFL